MIKISMIKGLTVTDSVSVTGGVNPGLLFVPELCVLDISVREICSAGAGGKNEVVPRPRPGWQEGPKHTSCERKENTHNTAVTCKVHTDPPASNPD